MAYGPGRGRGFGPDGDKATVDPNAPLDPNDPANSSAQSAANAQEIDTGKAANGGHVLAGTVAPNFGGSQYGTNVGDYSAYDQDVARDRAMGAASNARAAPQLDQTQADQSRGYQLGSLDLLRTAAEGNAPSRAAALGQLSTSNAYQAQLQQAGAARGGPGAAIAAMRGAQGGAAQQMGDANLQIAGLRAKEMADAQQGYAHGAQGAEGQDIQAASANAQLEAQQRALNEARQQGFERRGWNVRNMESSAEDRYKTNTQNALNLNESNSLAQQARDSAHAQQVTGMIEKGISAGAGGVTGSDRRMKSDVHDLSLGSLGALGHTRRK